MPDRIDDHKKFWNDVLLADYQDFMGEIDNVRKAFHLASSPFHMADWLYWGNKAYIDANFTFVDKNGAAQPVSDERTFANAVRDLYPDFELIRGIANAGKHLQIRKGQHAASPVSASNTYVTSTGFGIAGFGMGPYGGTPRVRQQGPNDQDIEMTDLAKRIHDIWVKLCAAEKDVKYWREKWTNESGSPSLIGVGAFKFNGEYIDLDAKRGFIGPQIDEYRESLEAKTALLTDMVYRKIGLYSERERK